MLNYRQAGFTLVEICVALVMLSVAVLGLAASTGRMLEPSANAELEFMALESVQDRLAEISIDPRYGGLDSLYSGNETGLPGLPGVTRTTAVTRTQTVQAGGGVLDFSTVVVRATGGRLTGPVMRSLVVGAP